MADTAEGRSQEQQQQKEEGGEGQKKKANVQTTTTTTSRQQQQLEVLLLKRPKAGNKEPASLWPLTTKAAAAAAEREEEEETLSRGVASHVKGARRHLSNTTPPAAVTITRIVDDTPKHNSSSSRSRSNGSSMTVSSGIKDDDVVEREAFAASASPPRACLEMTKMDEDDDAPMNLSPDHQTNGHHEAINLSNKQQQAKHHHSNGAANSSSNGIALCAKMRLKKQRLMAAAEQAAARKPKQPLISDMTTTTTDVPMTSLCVPDHDPHSALHKLAEAAERKQEEEMMEIESGSNTPFGTPTPSNTPSNTPPTSARQPLSSGRSLISTILTPQLAPNTEYEVSSSSSSLARHYSRNGGGGGGGGAPAPTPSPDSAIHSAYYSPSQSPVQSRHTTAAGSGISSPFSMRTTPSLSRNNSDASQYGGSQYSYSSTTSPLSPTQQFSPSHSPVQGRHPPPAHGGPAPFTTALPSSPLPPARHLSLPLYPHGVIMSRASNPGDEVVRRTSPITEVPTESEDKTAAPGSITLAGASTPQQQQQQQTAGISRQQLINSPCPVCGDKISGFHYGIFSCESCKGFFKRTVQNKKNYVCLRGAACPVTIATRKKCPACRFEKCLKTGMKLEAIREDRTRGGRSTYQCSYTLPAGLTPSSSSSASSPAAPAVVNSNETVIGAPKPLPLGCLPSVPLPRKASTSSSPETVSPDSQGQELLGSSAASTTMSREVSSTRRDSEEAMDQPDEPVQRVPKTGVPALLQEIMDVEHLWFSSKPVDGCGNRLGLASAGPSADASNGNGDMVQTLTVMADKRLFKLVKWCKSLPLFKNILIDDQITLLINAWCELLVFSCCFRSVSSPGVIRVSNESSLTLEMARAHGVEKCVEKMLNFTDQLRRLKVDYYEYVSMKVIVLLTSDASGLKEPEHVRDSQEKVVQSLQQYTAANYPDMPSKFGELLLRMPELQRVCQVGKEVLCPRQPSEGESSSFNLLMELLRGDH